MTKARHLFFGFTVALALLGAAPAQAQNNVSFVSSTGGGITCTRVAPCHDFGPAVDATVDGGEINCLDSGPFQFGIAAITKSITIDCAGLPARGTVLRFNAPGIVVRLRNLTLDGGVSTDIGLDFISGAKLIIEHCLIQNYNTLSPFIGIRFRPSTTSQLVVSDTTVINSGSGSTGGGIVINPQAGGTAEVVLNRVTVTGNVFGIAVDGTGSTGGVNMSISDSVSTSNSQDGIIAVTPNGGAPIGVYVKNTKSVNNNYGIRSIGPNVTVRVDGSGVIGNSTGVSFSAGGALLSFGNNAVRANGTDGAFSGPVALQ
jgi:hypothetical protein